ncbi:MAG: FxsA family protein, partial [Thermoguttaceae bacterium]
FILGAAARLAAGVLFIVPGILTDLMALLLISPAGKRLVQFFVASLFGKMFPHTSIQDYFSGTSGETPAKDEIIDVRVVNDGEKKLENGP